MCCHLSARRLLKKKFDFFKIFDSLTIILVVSFVVLISNDLGNRKYLESIHQWVTNYQYSNAVFWGRLAVASSFRAASCHLPWVELHEMVQFF